jgi:prevent-host-death family protein
MSDGCTYIGGSADMSKAGVGEADDTGKVGIRELGRNPSKIIARLVETGQPVIITDRGRPVAVLTPIDEAEVEDFILTHAEQFIRDREHADHALAAGATYALPHVLAELDD